MRVPWYLRGDDKAIQMFSDHRQYAELITAGEKLSKDEQLHAATNAARLCKRHPAFLAHEFLDIRLGRSGRAKFDCWTPGQIDLYCAVQRQRFQKKPVRIIILKARRQGISTLVEALAFWRTALFPDTSTLIAAHEDDASSACFEMFKLFFESLPDAFKPEIERFNTDEIVFDQPERFGKKKKKRMKPGLGSRIRQRTVAPGAGTKERQGKGRSQAFHFAHCSEGAYWDEPEKFWTGVSQCIEDYPETYVFHESTANGFGWWAEMWEEASKGWDLKKDQDGSLQWKCHDPRASNSDLLPVFLSWLGEPKYSKPFESEDDRQYLLRHLDPEETALINTYGATPEQVNWRRTTLYGNKFNGNINLFHQEYPTSPSEAFISSGRKVFDSSALTWGEHKIRDSDVVGKRYDYWLESDGVPNRAEDDAGSVIVFREPVEGSEYALGIDCSYGKERGDFMSGNVLRVDTWEQVAVVHGRLQTDEMARICCGLGRYFNEAVAIPETNGPGLAVMQSMDRLGYQNFYFRTVPDVLSGKIKKESGWYTSTKTRTVLVHALKSAVRGMPRGEGLILHYMPTLREMQGWVLKRSPSGKAKEAPATGQGHDDQIMSLGFALVGGCIEGGFGAPIASKTVGNPAGVEPIRTGFYDPAVEKLLTGNHDGQSYHPVIGANF